MSDRILDQKKKRRLEDTFMKFLKTKIKYVGGTIQLQHLTGHLSQLNPDVRNFCGSSKADILNFLKNHSDVFNVNNNIVSLVNSDTLHDRDYDSDNSSIDSNSSLPDKISKGTGVIVKLFPGFGFIKTKEPVKTSVYFSAKHFGYDYEVNLTECDLNIGTMVYFNAFKEQKKNYTSKYHASKVWKVYKVDESNVICKTRKNRETGLYDPINIDGEGKIQKVFPIYGFITAIENDKNIIFFHKNRVANYDNIVDLTKVFNIGDSVEFSAHRSTKSDAKVRWEAAKVWKKSHISSSIKKLSNDASCMSGSNNVESNQPLTHFESKNKNLLKTVNQTNSAKEMIHNQPGKICPRSHGAVIKFGEKFAELADGDSSVYYISGTQVFDIGWEFSEGDDVKFDAVKIKSAPGWKAVLVWIGDKPNVVLPTCLGDFSEFTDEEVDEIPEDSSSVSSNYLSFNSISSLKSLSMKSESSSGFKSNLSCKNSSKVSDSPPTTVKFPRSYEIKSSDLCTTPSCYDSQSSSTSSKVSDKSESSSFKSNLSHQNSSQMGDSFPTTVVKFPKKDGFKSSNSCTMLPYDSKCDSSSSKATDTSSEQQISENSRRNRLGKMESNSVLNSRGTSESSVQKEIVSESKHTDADEDTYSNYSLNITNETNAPAVDQKHYKFSQELDMGKIKNRETSEGESASIKKLQSIVGKITKVHSSIAEVKSSELCDPVPFFWSSFYCDGASKEELELNDLRQVLKVGDTVYFNYFEIVDDLGESWKQVSLAWTGRKPKVCEETPNDFIKQNQLSVTIKEDLNNIQPVKTIKKFLTSFDDISPDKSDECASHSESSSDGVEDDKTFPSLNTEKSQVPELATSFKELSDMISQKMLMNKYLFMDAKVDLNSLSSEIINLISERFNGKVSRSFTKEDFQKEISTVTCSSCGKKISEESSQNVITKDTEVQTIFTGEVMAQNIYTQC